MENKLEKTLGIIPAVGLAITMVLGSGLLILPGLAYQKTGGAALYSWIICALISIPLLIVFASLGSKFPGAGGIASYMQAVFSRRAGAATEILILGTIPGGAALAVTGGKYFSSIFDNSQFLVVLGTVIVLSIGGAVNYLGAKMSGAVQQILAATLVILLCAVALIALFYGDTSQGEGIAPISHAFDSLPSVGLVFFAFVGWELMSFTTEEFKNPKRDFPLMIAVSFVIIVALYILIASVIQLVLPITHPSLSQAPISGLLSVAFGSSSGKVVSFLGFLIALANFISVVWAFSRLIFSSAREGLLPPRLSLMNPKNKTPQNAVIAIIAVFAGTSVLYFTGIASQEILFELAGISFFMSYMLAVIAYIKETGSRLFKFFGILILIAVLIFFITFGLKILYPILIFVTGYTVHLIRSPNASNI